MKISIIFIAVLISISQLSFAQTLCPDGSYVGGSQCILAPDGTYVGGTPQMAPDGSYVGGTPQMAPDGSYFGGDNSNW